MLVYLLLIIHLLVLITLTILRIIDIFISEGRGSVIPRGSVFWRTTEKNSFSLSLKIRLVNDPMYPLILWGWRLLRSLIYQLDCLGWSRSRWPLVRWLLKAANHLLIFLIIPTASSWFVPSSSPDYVVIGSVNGPCNIVRFLSYSL